MKKQLQILLAGALVVVPLAVTAWVIVWAGSSLDALGTSALSALVGDVQIPLLTVEGEDGIARLRPGVGAVVLIVAIYLVGLLAQLWIFKALLEKFEDLLCRLPGIKTIYESIRDLMKLFGGESGKMGKVVLYRQPETDLMILGIMTNDQPAGVAENCTRKRVAIYQPYSYMFGGPTIYVPAEQVQQIDMTVDQALKLATTAHVGARSMADLPEPEATKKDEPEQPTE
ncbi:MAG: DUF502 domain-containing protein [Phycisphaerae bacterium]